jgi:hypothetical protein
MMILAKPSISPYLARSLARLRVPVIIEEGARIPMQPALQVLAQDTLRRAPRQAYESPLLTSSENGLALLQQLIPHDNRVLKAGIFKDKAAFRRAIARNFPAFQFREVPLAQLDAVQASELRFPLVLKPTTGISSIGVCIVRTPAEWPEAVKFLKLELAKYGVNYNDAVVKASTVLIETYIEGTELAIDGYFNSRAEPVVLNILEHLFNGPEDTSDKIYCTTRALVRQHLQPIMAQLQILGDTFDLKSFPFHMEVRHTPNGDYIPIEVNPLRFAGVGTTEVSEYSYGVNVYDHFFQETRPDWDTILDSNDNSYYGFFCADIPTDLYRQPGLAMLDRKLYDTLNEVLVYRILDVNDSSTFAILFFRADTLEECRRYQALDLREFLQT